MSPDRWGLMAGSDACRRLYAAVLQRALSDVKAVTPELVAAADKGVKGDSSAKKAEMLVSGAEQALGWLLSDDKPGRPEAVTIEVCAEILGIEISALRRYAVKLARDNGLEVR